MQIEKYIGLKYKEKGRDFDGLDCWGLVRLFYKNEYKIDLPSFSSEYEQTDVQRIQDLIAQYKEGWESIEKPVEGSIVLFRVLGTESHVGVALNEEQFLHVRENQDSAIENLSSPFWKKRIVGYFKYSENKSVILNAVPHPLRTERYTIPILPGTNLSLLVSSLNKEYGVAEELKSKVNILVNGIVVDQKDWETTILNESDTVEYRAVPRGGNTGRLVAVLALAFVAPQLAGWAESAYFASAGVAGGATAFTTTAVYAAAYGATMLAGTALINAIAPIRPPVGGASASGNNPGSAERQLMVNGGANRINPYGSIPVILGRVRVTPPLGSVNYLTYDEGRNSYLSMLLVWGYGPLYIDVNTFRIGDVPLLNYSNYQIATISGGGYPVEQYNEGTFNEIYGKDVDPDNLNIPITCEGNPENRETYLSGDLTIVDDGGGFVSEYKMSANLSSVVSGRTFSIQFTSNTTNWSIVGTGVTNLNIQSPNSTTRIVTGTTTSTTAFVEARYLAAPVGESLIASFIGYLYTSLTPGSYIESSSDQNNNFKALIAVHFPQGLRKIKVKGSDAGNAEETSVRFNIEKSEDGINWVSSGSASYLEVKSNNKDAFTNVFEVYRLSGTEVLKYIRIRRITGDNTEDIPDYRYYHDTVLLNVNYISNQKPAVNPKDCLIAKTAIRIKATDQLSGNLEGFNGVVQTYAKVWNGTDWVMDVTSNPAALFRYVLEHPGNPRKVTNAASQINLTQLQYFFEYCAAKGFEYNAVLADTRSVLDVLRDICAAGRASPAIIDGKWTVIIDEVKPNIIQHFTPHNSWGFEGNKPLPKKPDGLRVTYFDEASNYQENEIIVYDNGKDASNSSLFESLTLPGVTKKQLVIDHAKWHFAQIKLRPEVYTLNVDIEYLVCNRGDRVKVTHDVPMWGLGSGRIKNVINSNKLQLDEAMPMVAGRAYTIRIRKNDGSSIVATVASKSSDGYYDEIDLAVVPSGANLESGNLFLFGEINSESQDLLVLSVEPSNNKTARLTLVDYGVTSEYNIFTDYLNLSSSTVFEAQITQLPRLRTESFGDNTPTITTFVSDESVMEQISKGVFKYNMTVGYYNPYQLPTMVQSVQAQYDLASATDTLSSKYVSVDYQNGGISIPDVIEGETYKVRLRYVSSNGIVGKWSEYSTHTVTGKSNPPSDILISTISTIGDKSNGQVNISWPRSPEIDVSKYEIRRTNTNWGLDNGDLIYLGDNTNTQVTFQPSFSYFIRPIDYFGNYSVNATAIIYIALPVPNPNNFSSSFSTTGLTNIFCSLKWDQVTTSEFNIAYYELSYDSIVEKIQTTSFDVKADWLGSKVFTLKAVDIHGRKSSGVSISAQKARPNPPTNLKTQVIDNTVMLYWKNPVVTTLPINHVLVKRGPSWQSPDFVIGEKKGEFTTSIENTGGQFTYWLAAVDTSGEESDPVPVTTVVTEPPDFIFHGDFNSNFNSVSSVFSNAVRDDGGVVAPVNTTETWEQHFTSRGWNTIQDQTGVSNNNYPYYVQPTNSTAYYEEIFVSSSILESSKITLAYTGEIIVAPVNVVPSIAISEDGITYTTYDGTTSIYGINFKYIKIRLTITSSTDKGLYKLKSLYLKLDAKLKSDAGKVTITSTSSEGKIVNFNKEFIDVQSISVSANGTGFLNPVYNFKDNIVIATYSVSSNVCTVTSNNHGLIANQKVNLMFSSGTGIEGIYTITSATTNTFTVTMNTTNGSGNCRFYPESFTVFLFDSNGNQVTGEVSWTAIGY